MHRFCNAHVSAQVLQKAAHTWLWLGACRDTVRWNL
jgi:hypothetical protein